ncbi:transcriptional regulator, LysR family domain protein [Yersinia ruckeri ATCC 29473]|uniref:Uncharacterized protein n=1 Tax=Yersinia ruckeri TaxID=29486 RepID=A0A380QSA7_YERRU|nr:hypothetical protein QMA0440_00728 [Yersinia ruckeri]KGA50934.1 transcriptional regulator, LysR family domain protein [Yersinia ruckeri ATCC 29473]KFE38554.1 CysB family transcriptional regulator [Yersinia ruckeri]QTD77612.1 Uncharacterized protein YR821_2694 [Yersinia ruckeri]CNB46105.1 Uncharacterised protein [Yersinia ruckeri]
MLPFSHCQLTDEPLVALVAKEHVLAIRLMLTDNNRLTYRWWTSTAALAHVVKLIALSRPQGSNVTSILRLIISNGWKTW